MKRLLGFAAILFLFFSVPGFAAAQKKSSAGECPLLAGIPSGHTRVIDMTYLLNDHSPAWPGDEHPFVATVNATPEKQGYFTRKISMLEHYGTHMDAPAHFPGGKQTLDQIAIQRFFGPGVVLDIHEKAAKDPDYQLTVKDIQEWESRHGQIPPHAIVMLYTGWGSRWPDQTRYRNMDAKNVMHFPGYSLPAAKARKLTPANTITDSIRRRAIYAPIG